MKRDGEMRRRAPPRCDRGAADAGTARRRSHRGGGAIADATRAIAGTSRRVSVCLDDGRPASGRRRHAARSAARKQRTWQPDDRKDASILNAARDQTATRGDGDGARRRGDFDTRLERLLARDVVQPERAAAAEHAKERGESARRASEALRAGRRGRRVSKAQGRANTRGRDDVHVRRGRADVEEVEDERARGARQGRERREGRHRRRARVEREDRRGGRRPGRAVAATCARKKRAS